MEARSMEGGAGAGGGGGGDLWRRRRPGESLAEKRGGSGLWRPRRGGTLGAARCLSALCTAPAPPTPPPAARSAAPSREDPADDGDGDEGCLAEDGEVPDVAVGGGGVEPALPGQRVQVEVGDGVEAEEALGAGGPRDLEAGEEGGALPEGEGDGEGGHVGERERHDPQPRHPVHRKPRHVDEEPRPERERALLAPPVEGPVVPRRLPLAPLRVGFARALLLDLVAVDDGHVEVGHLRPRLRERLPVEPPVVRRALLRHALAQRAADALAAHHALVPRFAPCGVRHLGVVEVGPVVADAVDAVVLAALVLLGLVQERVPEADLAHVARVAAVELWGDSVGPEAAVSVGPVRPVAHLGDRREVEAVAEGAWGAGGAVGGDEVEAQGPGVLDARHVVRHPAPVQQAPAQRGPELVDGGVEDGALVGAVDAAAVGDVGGVEEGGAGERGAVEAARHARQRRVRQAPALHARRRSPPRRKGAGRTLPAVGAARLVLEGARAALGAGGGGELDAVGAWHAVGARRGPRRRRKAPGPAPDARPPSVALRLEVPARTLHAHPPRLVDVLPWATQVVDHHLARQRHGAVAVGEVEGELGEGGAACAGGRGEADEARVGGEQLQRAPGGHARDRGAQRPVWLLVGAPEGVPALAR
eukprot:3082312-Rhodomonas_salina.1